MKKILNLIVKSLRFIYDYFNNLYVDFMSNVIDTTAYFETNRAIRSKDGVSIVNKINDSKNTLGAAREILYSLSIIGLLKEPFSNWINGIYDTKLKGENLDTIKYVFAIKDTADAINNYINEVEKYGEILSSRETDAHGKIYEYKGKKYSIFIETKAKIDGVWTEAIVYLAQYENPDGLFWIRTRKEFFELFKEVK